MKHTLLTSALCISLLLSACNNQTEKPATTTKAAEKTPPAAAVDTQKAPAPAAALATAHPPAAISGKILETMDAGGYTYLHIDSGKGQQWVAIPEAKVKVGDEVACHEGIAMPNFTSKSLNRTFDSIIFSAGIVGQTPPAAGPHGMGEEHAVPNPHAAANPHAVKPGTDKAAEPDPFASAIQAETPSPAMQSMTESGGSLGAIAPFAEIKVDKAAGDNGYRVSEVFANNTSLDGKTIRVQGKVVKFSPNIMGKNWVHLQDGSGDPLNNTHDLVITTSAEPPKDKETITIEGVVRANKDFGAGYSYVVLVEDAKILN